MKWIHAAAIALSTSAATGWVSYNFGWDHGYWRGTRTAQWNCFHNRKTCDWAASEPPISDQSR